MEQTDQANTVISRAEHQRVVDELKERAKHLQTQLDQAILAKRGALRRAEAAERLAMEIHRLHSMPMPPDTLDP